MGSSSLQTLLDFLVRLDSSKIHYRLESNRHEAIMVHVAVPGERWEVEFFDDGHVEVEIFKSTREELKGAEALAVLFEKYSD